MVNVDVTTGVMFKGAPYQHLHDGPGINNVRELQGQQKRDIPRRFLKGLTFQDDSASGGWREKVYKITDIAGLAMEIRF